MNAVLQIRMNSNSFWKLEYKQAQVENPQAAACVVKVESRESQDRSRGNFPAVVSPFASFGFSLAESGWLLRLLPWLFQSL